MVRQHLALVTVVVVICFAALLSLKSRSSAKLDKCFTNVNQVVAPAVERYMTEHQGQPPSSLADLVPGCLDKLPKCPAAAQMTYVLELNPKNGYPFDVYCSGYHHPDAPPDFPRIATALRREP